MLLPLLTLSCVTPKEGPQTAASEGTPAAEASADASCSPQMLGDAARRALADGGEAGQVVIVDLASGEVVTEVAHAEALAGPVHPASTVKPMLAVAALEAGVVSPDESLPCDGEWTHGEHSIDCFHAHSPQTLESGLATSCNSYFLELAARLGPGPLADQFEALGLGEVAARTREAEGMDLYAIALGHGAAAATPKQVAEAYARLLRSGSPHLPTVLAGMRRTIEDEDGSGHALAIDGLAYGGKSGTADSETPGRYHAWFAAVAPASDPQLLVVAHVDSDEVGAKSAGPVVRSVLEVWRGCR